jgi:DNA-binding Lrp family transcriptional regulator
MESTLLAADDRLLVDALQVAPRAPWSAIGGILGITAITASRRWQRLVDDGLAWVTAAPGMARRNAQCMAYVEITCRPADRMTVAMALAQHQLAVTVELTTGSADILVTVAAADLTKMSHYLLEHLGHVPGVLSTRARFATRIYSEGSAWRVRELPASAVATLARIQQEQTADPGPEGPVTLTDNIKAMLTHLAVDGRASYIELAERAGIGATTARRYLARLVRSGMVILRTDVCAPAVGWPVQAYLWANTPVESLDDTAHILSSFRQARLCATVTAGPSLALCSWLHAVEEVHRLELSIAHRLPHVEVVDRLVVLRQIKRMGRLLDESGRAVGVVPINLWDDLLH